MTARTTGPIRVLLVDDHAIMRQGLRMLIENHGDIAVVGEAARRSELREVASQVSCDVVLLDLALGDESGIDVIADVARIGGNPRVLVLTGVKDGELHRRAIREGAAGVVLKDQAADFLIKAIRRVDAGEIWVDRAMTAEILREYRRDADVRAHDADAERIAQLTQREREIAGLVAQGLGTQKIASALAITEKTVRNHLASIYDKLQVSERLELALYAARHGLSSGAR